MKLFITSLFFTLFCATMYGQQDKQKIIKLFDKVTYYADSTIKCAYFTKHHKFDGYAIEFDSLGQPIAIGQYWKGKNIVIGFIPTTYPTIIQMEFQIHYYRQRVARDNRTISINCTLTY